MLCVVSLMTWQFLLYHPRLSHNYILWMDDVIFYAKNLSLQKIGMTFNYDIK